MSWLSTISLTISVAIHNLIPSLFNLFEMLANLDFMNIKGFKGITNNLYLIVSAVMLFAFGVRLLSIIVNPDSMNDKKKGLSVVFRNAIIGIILIGVVPFSFNLLREFQKDVLDKNLIGKYVFGIENIETQNIGESLRDYAFSAFFYYDEAKANKKNGVQSLILDVFQLIPTPYASDTTLNFDENTSFTDVKVIIFFVHLIFTATAAIPLTGPIFGTLMKNVLLANFTYHAILSPILGAFIVYNLILLCMDTALRAVKLVFLELLTPLVICGYIFSGADILTKWTKEVFSTYISLFLRVAAINFIVLAFSKIDDILASFNGINSLQRGFILLFITIALLQLIKLIPDLINSIFGTKIKSKGGISGRLGEMAAIGGLAKSAWDKAKPAMAKAGLAAGILATPMGIGAAVGAGAGAFQWKKGFKGTTPWKDTKFGKGLRTVGAGAKAVGTGLTAKGGIIKGVEAGYKSFSESDAGKGALDAIRLSQAEKSSRRMVDAINRMAHVDPNENDDSKKVAYYDGQTRTIKFNDYERGIKALEEIESGSKDLDDTQKQIIKRRHITDRTIKALNEVSSQKSNLAAMISGLNDKVGENDPQRTEKLSAIATLSRYIDDGGNIEAIRDHINKMYTSGAIDKNEAHRINAAFRKITAEYSSIDDVDVKRKLFVDGEIKLTGGTLKTQLEIAKDDLKKMDATFETTKKQVSSTVRETLELYDGLSSDLNTQVVLKREDKKNGYVSEKTEVNADGKIVFVEGGESLSVDFADKSANSYESETADVYYKNPSNGNNSSSNSNNGNNGSNNNGNNQSNNQNSGTGNPNNSGNNNQNNSGTNNPNNSGTNNSGNNNS